MSQPNQFPWSGGINAEIGPRPHPPHSRTSIHHTPVPLTAHPFPVPGIALSDFALMTEVGVALLTEVGVAVVTEVGVALMT